MRPVKTNCFKLFLLIMRAPVAYLASVDYVKVEAHAYRTRIKDPVVIRNYLQSHPVRKLQLGAGGNDPPGWLNSDIEPIGKEIYLDATDRSPFPYGSFQYMLIEHVIEHVPWEARLAMPK